MHNILFSCCCANSSEASVYGYSRQVCGSGLIWIFLSDPDSCLYFFKSIFGLIIQIQTSSKIKLFIQYLLTKVIIKYLCPDNINFYIGRVEIHPDLTFLMTKGRTTK